nr:type III effector [Erwinia amylovora]
MINPLLYLRTNILNDSKAAVQYANKLPTKKNIELANKLLNAEAENAVFRRNDASNQIQAQARLARCMDLLDKLEVIAINKTGDINLIVRSGFLLHNRSTGVNIRRREKFTDFNLSDLALTYRDLRNCDFQGANRMTSQRDFKRLLQRRPDFSRSTLDGVDLSDVFIFNPVFKNTSMTGARFTIRVVNPFQHTPQSGLCYCDFTGAILDKAVINLQLPSVLSISDAALLLNDYGSQTTIFDILRTINIAHPEIKTKIIKEIISLIDSSDVNINSNPALMASLLNNIASENCYLNDNEVNSFFKKLIVTVIENANKKVNMDRFYPKVLSSFITMFNSFANAPRTKEHMIKYNGVFIQLMATCAYHEDPRLMTSARETYSNYLKLDAVKPFTAKTEFGNGESEPDWSEKGHFNFILVNGNKTMIIDHENLSAMLNVENSERQANWNQFFLYENNEILTQGELNHEKIFCDEFRIFEDGYRKEIFNNSLKKILNTLDLGIYHPRFESALSRTFAEDKDKIKTQEDMRNLTAIFEKVLTYTVDESRNYQCNLKQEHFDEITNAYGLGSKSDMSKARILFCLATLFTRYSSVYFLGAELDSPKALRDYANALMCKANTLDPQITGGHFDQWNNALLGTINTSGGIETCTSIIYQQMMEHAKTHFPAVMINVTPPGWR